MNKFYGVFWEIFRTPLQILSAEIFKSAFLSITRVISYKRSLGV